MFWVYILQNPVGRCYVGHTDDLPRRVANHNRTDKIAGKFTRKHGPWVLVWTEEHLNRSSAMGRERKIKGWKSAPLVRSRLLVGANSNAGAKRMFSGLYYLAGQPIRPAANAAEEPRSPAMAF